MAKLVLASASPRRADLLHREGFSFDVVPCPLDEAMPQIGSLAYDVCLLAAQKATYAAGLTREDALVLGADTIVVVEEQILGKPKSTKEAAEMLARLSGKCHRVMTGVCILDTRTGYKTMFCEQTAVCFRALTEKEIAAYVATGEAMDKAGAYAAQGGAHDFICSMDGDFDNVVGLPAGRVRRALWRHGVRP